MFHGGGKNIYKIFEMILLMLTNRSQEWLEYVIYAILWGAFGFESFYSKCKQM